MSLLDDIGTLIKEEPSTVHRCALYRGQVSHHGTLARGHIEAPILFVGACSRENSLLERHLIAGAPSCPWLSVDTIAILSSG